MSDNITLPREVVKEAISAIMPFSNPRRELKQRVVEALRTALAAEQPKPEPVESEDDEEFTREDVTTLLLEVMDWTYVQATRDRPMTDAEKKVIDDIRTALAASEPVQVEPTPRITRITCGFVDVRFDGERWFCGKCGERMPANYEAMVKHYSGDREHLELMQRKAAFKMGRDKT